MSRLWRNLKSLLPRRRFDPWRYGSDPHTSPWDNPLKQNSDELREIIDSGEIKMGGLPQPKGTTDADLNTAE